jgi:hypothetical protein
VDHAVRAWTAISEGDVCLLVAARGKRVGFGGLHMREDIRIRTELVSDEDMRKQAWQGSTELI